MYREFGLLESCSELISSHTGHSALNVLLLVHQVPLHVNWGLDSCFSFSQNSQLRATPIVFKMCAVYIFFLVNVSVTCLMLSSLNPHIFQGNIVVPVNLARSFICFINILQCHCDWLDCERIWYWSTLGVIWRITFVPGTCLRNWVLKALFNYKLTFLFLLHFLS